LISSAEESFKNGLRALSEGRRREALARFEAALKLEQRSGPSHPQPRYLSFYGLCLALESGRLREGLEFCRDAAAIESYNPDIRSNLGRVLLQAGRRKEAYEHFRGSLSLQGNHPGGRQGLKMLGIRRRPPIPFLSRRNPLNVLLGRLRFAYIA
jgi:Flp pilus assembly protein TadD